MALDGLNKLSKIYPLFIKKFEDFTPAPDNADMTVKINSLIAYLNSVGKLTNDVVKDWNNVMQWVMDEGLTEGVSDKVEQLIADNKLNELIDPIVAVITDLAQEQIDLIENNQVATKSEINDVTAQLAQNWKKLTYKEKQSGNLSKAYRKLWRREAVTIDAYGDSLTYGYDITSADKRDNSVTFPDGSTYSQTMASKTYPESLQEKLNLVYEGKITVNNKGCGGDWVEKGFTRWKPKQNPTGSDIAIMAYGVNDSRNSSCPYVGEVDTFLQKYREFIEVLLDNGLGIILMAPTKMSQAYDINVKSFSQAIYSLGDEYGIPVLNGAEILANYGVDCYSDATHLNGKGYDILGAKIASVFIANGLINPIVVDANTTLLTRRELDGMMFTTGVTFTDTSSYPTPDEFTTGRGIASTISTGSSVFYSFYLEEELYVLPYLGINTDASEAHILLDFGVEQPDYSIDKLTKPESNHDYTTREPSLIVYGNSDRDSGRKLYIKEIIEKKLPKLRIVSKGWHTVQIKAVGDSVGLGGITFKSLDNMFEPSHYSQKYLFNEGVEIATASGQYVKMHGSGSSELQNGIMFSTPLTPPSEYGSHLNAILGVANEEFQVNRMMYLRPSVSAPPAKRGGIYFDGSANKFMVCEDGTTWVNLI